MQTLSIAEVQARLPQLLEAVEAGEEIVLTRQGHPVARLIHEKQPVDFNEIERLLSGQTETSPSLPLIREMRDGCS